MPNVKIKQTPAKKLSPAVEEEIRLFEQNLQSVRAGTMNPDHFKKFRLNNGVYGIRNEQVLHMIRIKCPHGNLTSDQLEVVADLTEEFTRTKLAHITTRQAIQIHHVHIDNVTTVLRRLNESGLTTREACGNTVRNVTATPYAGFLADEVFDVTPYARALFDHYLRNPICQNFARKFKIAFFGGGKSDVAYTAIHDIGFVAAKRVKNGKEEKGFRVYVGGGLGATPHMAIQLEEFTPLEDFYPTADAVVHIFDRYGDRKDKFHARLKFVVRKFGHEKFREMVLAERNALKLTRAGGWAWTLPTETPLKPPAVRPDVDAGIEPKDGFELWRRTNTQPQKQAGYSIVTVVTPLGDMTVAQMRGLADIARRTNGGMLRTMIQQNIVLPWIRNEHLVALYNELNELGLSTPGALRISDITRCPGSDTCQLAVTKSRGLASAIGQLFRNGLAKDLDMENFTIKISGCTNSCGQHHIGNLGFFGTYRKIDGREVPHYQILVGGDAREGLAQFGKPVAAVPARRVPEAVKAIIESYKAERKSDETFLQYTDRVGRDKIKALVEPFRSLPSFEENKELYFEWGEYQEFKAEIGQGECAA